MARGRDTIEKALSRLAPGARFLLAVSGGIDSITMLHAFSALAARKKWHLEIAHVDHRVRATSAADARFVRDAAKKAKALFHLKRLAKCPRGENFESWARAQRYRFFGAIAKRRKLDWIVTAHSANDAAETLLMRLLANRELRGIAASEERRRVLRPFLGILRKDIERYADQHDLDWHEDETNRDVRFLRNRVRRRLIPMLEREFDPSVVFSLAERAEALEDDGQFFEDRCEQMAERLAQTGKWGSREWVTALRSALARLDAPLRYRLVDLLLFQKLGSRVGRRAGLRVAGFFRGNAALCELPGGFSLQRKRGGVALLRDRLKR